MKKRIYAMMDMTNKRFSPVLFMAVLMVSVCGTTAFALSPAETEGIVQNTNQTMIADTTPNHANTVIPTITPDMEQGDLENQSSNDNSLPPNELVPYTPVEPSQEQTYDRNMPRLIADN